MPRLKTLEKQGKNKYLCKKKKPKNKKNNKQVNKEIFFTCKEASESNFINVKSYKKKL